MCEDFKPTPECLNMLSAMSIFEILKDRSSAEVMTIISTVLDFHEIYNTEKGRSADIVGSVDSVLMMYEVMKNQHEKEGSYIKCKNDLHFWQENWKEILHATEEAEDGEK